LSWSPTRDSPSSPVPPKPPFHRNRGSPHSYSPRVEEFPHGQQQRPLPTPSQHTLGHDSRMNDMAPTLRVNQNHADPRRRDTKPASEMGPKIETSNENSLPHAVEAGSFHDTRDPRLRRTAQKQLSKQQENEDLLEVVHHDHYYFIANNAEGSKGESSMVDNVSYKSSVITSPIASSFLAVAFNETRSQKPKQKQKGHSVRNTKSAGLECPRNSQSQSVVRTNVSQSIARSSTGLIVSSSTPPITFPSTSTQPSLVGLSLTEAEHKSSSNLSEEIPTVQKQSGTSELESILLSEENLSSSSDILHECTSRDEAVICKEKLQQPLVFSLNEFDLNLDTEPSSEDERSISCSTLPALAGTDKGISQPPRWEITRNDLGRVLRLAKVDAMRITTGMNGRSTTPVKLATYASKSSPVTARNQNMVKSCTKRKRRKRRRKIMSSKRIESDNEDANDLMDKCKFDGMESTDDDEEDVNGDKMNVDYSESVYELNSVERTSSGLLKTQQANRAKQTEGEQSKDTEGMVWK